MLIHSFQELKEHEKDGKVYVEVEPDAKYFISMRRVGNMVPETLLLTPFVDQKTLGYYRSFGNNGHQSGNSEAYNAGLWSVRLSSLPNRATPTPKRAEPRPVSRACSWGRSR